MADPFRSIKLPSFGNAPETSQAVDSVKRKANTDIPDTVSSKRPTLEPSRIYYTDPSGDFDVFKYGRLANVPFYIPPPTGQLSLYDELKSIKRAIAVAESAFPVNSKIVQKRLASLVREDEFGNIFMEPFEDVLMLQIYDPALLKSSQSRSAKERLDKDPHDCAAWIEFASVKDDRQSERANLERRLLILQKALEINEGKTELLVEYVKVYDQLNDSKDTIELYRGLVAKYPSLYTHYFTHRLHCSRSFDVFKIQEEFEHGMDSMEYVKFLYHCGYTERALRIIEYLSRLYTGQDPETQYPSCPVDFLIIPPTVSSEQAAIAEWLGVEAYRSYKFACAHRVDIPYEDEMTEDPDRFVLFSDISNFSFKPTLSDILQLFGFDDTLPRPLVLYGRKSLQYERKKEAVMSMPVNVRLLLQNIVYGHLPGLDSDALIKCVFHFLLFGGVYSSLNVSSESTILAIILYLTCEQQYDLAIQWVLKLPPRFSRPNTLVSELKLFAKNKGHEVVLDVHEEQLFTLLNGYSKISNDYWSDPITISILLTNKHLLAQRWLEEHYLTSITVFELFIEWSKTHLSRQALIKKLPTVLNDLQVYILARLYPDLLPHYTNQLSTPFQAAQMILHSNTSKDCVNLSLQAINKYPYYKQLYMAAIDRQCAFGEYEMAMRVLSVLEERGLRCRTLLEELLH